MRCGKAGISVINPGRTRGQTDDAGRRHAEGQRTNELGTGRTDATDRRTEGLGCHACRVRRRANEVGNVQRKQKRGKWRRMRSSRGRRRPTSSSNAAFCRFYYGHPVSPQYHLVVPLSLSHFLHSLSTAAIKTPAKIDNLTVHDFGPEKRCRGKSFAQWVESNRNVLVVCSSFPVPVAFRSIAGPSTQFIIE